MSSLSGLSNQRRDFTLVIFILVSIGLHAGAIFMGAYFAPKEVEEVVQNIEIELEGEPDKPPPLGTNDTETGPPPNEEPTPPPIPEDTPPPPPIVESDFDVPEETPSPTPAERPAATPRATPSARAASSPGYNPNARPGAIRGVDAAHGGVVGGTGQVKSKGGRADFVSTPNMSVPYNLRQRLAGVKASASASITYAGGRITGVDITRSSGNASLDTAIKRHVQSNFRVKGGATGRAVLPVGIKL